MDGGCQNFDAGKLVTNGKHYYLTGERTGREKSTGQALDYALGHVLSWMLLTKGRYCRRRERLENRVTVLTFLPPGNTNNTEYPASCAEIPGRFAFLYNGP